MDKQTRLRPGAGGTVSRWLDASATYDPASMADAAGTSTTINVPGAALGDLVDCSFSLTLGAKVHKNAQVSSAGVVTVSLFNNSGGVVDLASGTLFVRVTKK